MEDEAALSQRKSTLRSRSGTIRKPFSDRTNTISQSQSSPTTPKPYSQPKTKSGNPISIASGGSAGDPSTRKPSTPPGGDEHQKRTVDKGKGKESTLAVPFGNKRKGYKDLPHTVPLKKINFDVMERRALAVMEGEAAQRQRRSTLRSSDSSRSRRNRTPLTDCTNTIFESQFQSSPATVVDTRLKPPHPPPQLPPQPNPTTAATESTTNYADPSTPLPPSRPSSSPGGDGNGDVCGYHTVYTRRQTADKRKGKEKALSVPFSSYSADRIVNAGYKNDFLTLASSVHICEIHNHLKADEKKRIQEKRRRRRNECEDMGLPEPRTVPLKKKQRHGQLKQDAASKQALQDYIEQQKAYFDEVDAFELEEEVGSGNELD